jgi:uncharacterized membrane protein YeiB
MQELTLTTPSLLFSAVSLILLAYTNRFISYASLVRTLKEKHQQTHDPKDIAQIANLRKRLYLTRSMQILGLPTLLRGLDVLHLYLMANHSRLDIWNRIASIGSFAMRMYLGNKYFRQCFRDTPTGYEFQIDVKYD